jgi:hypothetical protein
MAVLGSTVDPRLGAVSPAAIQALSQAGAATGQMYANIGSSIAGVVQDYKSKKDDEALQQAYLDSLKIDDDGNQKVDRKAFLEAAKEGKVPSKLANAYLKNQLDISAMQNDMAIQDKLAGYEGEKVGIAKDAEARLKELQKHQIELGDSELNIKAYEVLSDSYNRLAQLKLQRKQISHTQDFDKKEFDRKVAEADRAYVQKVAEFAKNNSLTQAQIQALNADTRFKAAETRLLEDERNSYTDTGIGVADEETYNNKLVSVLGIGDRITQWDPLNALEKSSILKAILEGVRGDNLNMNTPQMVDLQAAFDFFSGDDYVKESFKRVTGPQQPEQQQTGGILGMFPGGAPASMN